MADVAAGLPVAFHLWVFCVGAVVGSFLNVVIARVPKGESIVSPGSRCPKCGSAIRWYDNVPVVSWLVLRGRCRRCGQPISLRYPMVELLVAVLAVAVERRFGPTGAALGAFAFVAALVALAYIDMDTWLLPHQITWPLLAVGLASPLWNHALPWPSSLIGAGVGFALFAAIALAGEKLLKRETMGWGDAWLLAGIGAWLGWQQLFPVVMLSALQGSIVGIALILAGRDPARVEAPPPPTPPGSDDDWVPPKHAVPYGPFLSLAALEVLLLGPQIAALWDGLFRRLWS
ncbi:MAG TPA: prepilin peptidase [Myxococcales bacterium]|nr:prepilin peptidase [Myxococcales bacterium]